MGEELMAPNAGMTTEERERIDSYKRRILRKLERLQAPQKMSVILSGEDRKYVNFALQELENAKQIKSTLLKTGRKPARYYAVPSVELPTQTDEALLRQRVLNELETVSRLAITSILPSYPRSFIKQALDQLREEGLIEVEFPQTGKIGVYALSKRERERRAAERGDNTASQATAPSASLEESAIDLIVQHMPLAAKDEIVKQWLQQSLVDKIDTPRV